MPRRQVTDIIKELRQRDLEDDAEKIAERHACELAEMLGPHRIPAFVAARQELWSDLYATGNWSLPRLAKLFGRDHTTILSGIHAHYVRKMAPAVEATRLKTPLRVVPNPAPDKDPES